MNVSLAYKAVKLVTAHLRPSLEPQHLLSAIPNTTWPGRLQSLDLAPLIGQTKQVLLDGAHNAQSAQVLGSYVDRKLRECGRPVTWILSISRGKDVRELLSHFLRPGDSVFAVEFGPVDGMPWVQPESVQDILRAAATLGPMGKSSGGFRGTQRQSTTSSRICWKWGLSYSWQSLPRLGYHANDEGFRGN